VLVVLVMTALNILGSQAVAKAQTIVVIVVISILTLFAVATLANLDLELLAFPVTRLCATSCRALR
jgi:amino acid transporter